MKAPVLRASLSAPPVSEVCEVLLVRLGSQHLTPATRLVAFALACAVREGSSGRWFVTLSAAEVGQLSGLSERHVRRARAVLIRAGVFAALPIAAVGHLVLELPRPMNRVSQEPRRRSV